MENDDKKTAEQIEQEIKELYEKNRDIVLGLVKEEKLPEPRKLTRAERRKLDAADVNIFKIKPTDTRTVVSIKDDLADWVLDNIYPDFKFDDVDNNICQFFGEYVFGLSYKNDLAAKN